MRMILLILIIYILIFSGIGVTSLSINNSLLNRSLTIDKYDMVIIAPSIFSDELQSLIEHKNSIGVKTKLKTIENIYNEFLGRDDAEKIKYFIKYAYDTWDIDYVFLAGGKDELPVRYVNVISISNNFLIRNKKLPQFLTMQNSQNFRYISDLYYADIYYENGSFSSWDSNNNSVFGEMNDFKIIDKIDLYPDIYIGRVLCNNESEVEIIVDKIINYEKNVHDKSWFRNLIIIGGDTYPYFIREIQVAKSMSEILNRNVRLAWEGEYAGKIIEPYMDDFNITKIYASNYFGIINKKLTIENINQAINDGAGFLLISGHGHPTLFATYSPFNFNKLMPSPSGFSVDDIRSLSNSYKLPVAVISACSTADFDTNPSPFAWEFLKNKNGGTIASFACTTIGNLLPTTLCMDTLNGHLIKNIFSIYSEGIDIVGEIWGETIKRYLDDLDDGEVDLISNVFYDLTGDPIEWDHHLNVEQWILLGDPSLKIGGV
jgi:hypothetical protein